MLTDTATRAQRESTCNACEKKQGVRCSECGCFLMLLRKVVVATCPLGKW